MKKLELLCVHFNFRQHWFMTETSWGDFCGVLILIFICKVYNISILSYQHNPNSYLVLFLMDSILTINNSLSFFMSEFFILIHFLIFWLAGCYCQVGFPWITLECYILRALEYLKLPASFMFKWHLAWV